MVPFKNDLCNNKKCLMKASITAMPKMKFSELLLMEKLSKLLMHACLPFFHEPVISRMSFLYKRKKLFNKNCIVLFIVLSFRYEILVKTLIRSSFVSIIKPSTGKAVCWGKRNPLAKKLVCCSCVYSRDWSLWTILKWNFISYIFVSRLIVEYFCWFWKHLFREF